MPINVTAGSQQQWSLQPKAAESDLLRPQVEVIGMAGELIHLQTKDGICYV